MQYDPLLEWKVTPVSSLERDFIFWSTLPPPGDGCTSKPNVCNFLLGGCYNLHEILPLTPAKPYIGYKVDKTSRQTEGMQQKNL